MSLLSPGEDGRYMSAIRIWLKHLIRCRLYLGNWLVSF